jgi:hypothetical protein
LTKLALIPIQFELAQNEPWWNKGLKPLVQRNFIENWYKLSIAQLAKDLGTYDSALFDAIDQIANVVDAVDQAGNVAQGLGSDRFDTAFKLLLGQPTVDLNE